MTEIDWESPRLETDPYRALEEAVRVARASSHSRKLEAAQQAAFNGFADAFVKVVNLARAQRREIEALKGRVKTASLVGLAHE
jgi:hypothetical protein